uniref:Uncharacterized protein n=1 Tax=Romanomermis culicivorax TaxID=13658 RepID=A0A915JAT9_ROMCU
MYKREQTFRSLTLKLKMFQLFSKCKKTNYFILYIIFIDYVLHNMVWCYERKPDARKYLTNYSTHIFLNLPMIDHDLFTIGLAKE